MKKLNVPNIVEILEGRNLSPYHERINSHMKRTEKMTSVTAYKPFQVEILAPGQYVQQCKETWNGLTREDKERLIHIMGKDLVSRIEKRIA